MRKFCDELWRIAKFLVIYFAITLPISYLGRCLLDQMIVSSADEALRFNLVSYMFNLLSTVSVTLANRYFTFRATEKWYIAVPMMVGAQLLWSLLGSYTNMMLLNWLHGTPESIMAAAQINSVLWVIVSYLLQRCVIYCHTLDTNGWYRRFHPTYDEEGENPDE